MKRHIALLLASVLVMALPVSAEGSYDWPFIEKIPIDSTYTQQAEHRGRVEHDPFLRPGGGGFRRISVRRRRQRHHTAR